MPAQQGPVIRLSDFSGGLNVRDSQNELDPTDLSVAVNVTMDEQGAVSSRLGNVVNSNTLVTGTNTTVSNMYYSSVHGRRFIQIGTKLQDENASVIKTFTTTARCAMVDFAGLLCVVHPADGFFTWDGATFSAVAAGPKADALVSWQGRLWANDKSGTNPKARVNFSDPGSTAVWGHNVDIRDVNDDQVVALFSGQGQDIKGAPGLLVFKQRSSYRINDSSTGAYTTIDPFVGAGGALCVVGAVGKIFVLSRDGLFTTDGALGLTKVSGKLDPIFTPAMLAQSTTDLWCLGVKANRVFLSVITAGNTVPNLAMEHHAEKGWFTLHTMNIGAMIFEPRDGKIHWGSAVTAHTELVMDSGGMDDGGGSISAVFQTRWIELNNGHEAFLNWVRINGRYSNTTKVAYNYDPDLSAAPVRNVNIPQGTSTSHGGYWDIYNLGRAKAFAFNFSNGTSTTGTIPINLTSATGRTVGAWGINSIDIMSYGQLGRS